MTARSMDHHPTTPICTSAGPRDCSISNLPPHHTPGDRQGPRRVHDRRLARPRLDGPAVGLRPQLGLHPLQGPGAQPHEPVVSERASERPMVHPSTKSVYVPTVWLPRTHNDFIRTQNNPQVVRADERPGPEPHSGGPAPQRLHRQEVRSSSTGAPSPVLVTHHPTHPKHVCTLTLTTGAQSSPSSS